MAKLTHGLTHSELVEIAMRWLRNTEKCSAVISEMASSAGEEPDAIGWKSQFSTLVECKATRDDFRKDKKKISRRVTDQAINFGMGAYRYYMAPEGLLKEEELPPRWGLLEVGFTGRVRRKVRAEQWIQTATSIRRELGLALSALRRLQEAERNNADKESGMILNWYRDYDANDKELWAAVSPYHDDGSPFYFRIKEIEEDGTTGLFGFVSDAELMLPAYEALRFATLEEAKAFCQKQCDEIIVEAEKEQRASE